MTLLINASTKDFNIISADKRVNIKDENKKILSINDNFNKIVRSNNNQIIVGISGNARNHHYVDKIRELKKPEEVISIIKKFVYKNNDINKALDDFTNDYDSDGGLCSFFYNNQFHTLFYETSLIHSNIRLYTEEFKNISFIPGGSGFDDFVELVKTEEFKKKREEIDNIDKINNKIMKTEKLLNFIFEKVSQKNNSVSKEYFSYLSTKRKTEFKLMKSS